MKTIVLILLATASLALGQKYGRGSDTGVDFLVQRARMVLADPGRWAPEHVERARQIMATHYQMQQQAAAKRDADYAEMEYQAEQRRIQALEEKTRWLKIEADMRNGASYSNGR